MGCAMADKVWLASKYTNRLSHRALNTFEKRNPSIFDMGHSVHATREEAVAALVRYRREAVAKAKKELASAERALAKALSMQKEFSNA